MQLDGQRLAVGLRRHRRGGEESERLAGVQQQRGVGQPDRLATGSQQLAQATALAGHLGPGTELALPPADEHREVLRAAGDVERGAAVVRAPRVADDVGDAVVDRDAPHPRPRDRQLVEQRLVRATLEREQRDEDLGRGLVVGLAERGECGREPRADRLGRASADGELPPVGVVVLGGRCASDAGLVGGHLGR